jgi:hypothetical protein
MSQPSNPLQTVAAAVFYQGWLLYLEEVEELTHLLPVKRYKHCCIAPELDYCGDWQSYSTPEQAIAAGKQLVEQDAARQRRTHS